MRIHSRKMNVNQDVNFEELSHCTEDFNGAQCKAVCVEAVSCNIIPLIIQNSFRRGATELSHEDYMEGLWWSCDYHVVLFFLFINCMCLYFLRYCVFLFTGILEVQAKKKTNLVYYA